MSDFEKIKKYVPEDFYDLFKGDDDLSVVVKAHLHIEYALNEVIENALIHKGHFSDEDLNYDLKLKLAISLGLRENLKSPLKCLGTIRNRFAHNLNESLSKNSMDNFYKSFASEDQAKISAIYADMVSQKIVEGDKNHKNLPPQDRFTIYAVILRTIIAIAQLQQETP